jgi:hypothetical protein
MFYDSEGNFVPMETVPFVPGAGFTGSAQYYAPPEFLTPGELEEWNKLNLALKRGAQWPDIRNGVAGVVYDGTWRPLASFVADVTKRQREIVAGHVVGRSEFEQPGEGPPTFPWENGDGTHARHGGVRGGGPATRRGNVRGEETVARGGIGTGETEEDERQTGTGDTYNEQTDWAEDVLNPPDGTTDTTDTTDTTEEPGGRGGTPGGGTTTTGTPDEDVTTEEEPPGDGGGAGEGGTAPPGWDQAAYDSLGPNAKAYVDANPDPTQHPDGAPAWQGGFDAAKALDDAGDGEDGTGPDDYNDFWDQMGDWGDDLPDDFDPANIGKDPAVDRFINDLLNADWNLSDEEKFAVRKEVEEGVQAALSNLSARGLGRGSKAVQSITIGEIQARLEIARKQGDLRTDLIEQQLNAVRIQAGREAQSASNFFTYRGQEYDRTVADRNFYAWYREQKLDEVRNAQGYSLEQRMMALKEDYLALDQDKQAEMVRQFNEEFSMAFDAQVFDQIMRGAEFDQSVIDSDRSYELRQTALAMDWLSTQREQDIQEMLGIGKLEMERWIAGERIAIDRMGLALHHLAIMNNMDISLAQINADLAALEAEQGDDFWDTALQYGFTIAKLFG